MKDSTAADYDPCLDEQLTEYAINNGLTHICIETGSYYRSYGGDVVLFKRDCEKFSMVASDRDPCGIDSVDFIKLDRKGSIYDNLDKIRDHFLESCTPVVLYGNGSRGKTLLVAKLNKVDGINAAESCCLYGMPAEDEMEIMREVISTISEYDARQSVIFSTTDKEVARFLGRYIPSFHLDDDRSDISNHV